MSERADFPEEYPRTDAPVEGNWSTIGRSASTTGEDDPDERIREDVCDRLMQFGPVDCVAIDVTVVAGVVTLKGDIINAAAKARVEEVVRSVAGVLSIENSLHAAHD